MMRIFWTIFSLITLLLMFPAYSQQAMRLPVDSTPLIIEGQQGKVRFDVEIATSPQDLSRGLMFRQDFPNNRAMLFVFATTHVSSMWMKNTPLPLDMLFVDEQGIIVSIFSHTEPLSQTIISAPTPVRYVIELNAGMADTHAIKPGDRAVHPIICAACTP